MKIGITADLHLTDRPEDEYRWKAFDHVVRESLTSYGAQEIYLLGDILDRKDRFPARLLNRLDNTLGGAAANTKCRAVKNPDRQPRLLDQFRE